MSGFGSKTASTYNTGVPAHYIAGLGRGATGFTTRSDIGPARPAVGASTTVTTVVPGVDPVFGQAPAGYVAGRGRGMGDLARGQGELPASASQAEVDPDRGDYSESNYDEFNGYSGALFAGSAYEEDDAEADQIYDTVDEYMDGRHKRRREQHLLQQQKNKKNNRPKITEQFADLKRELATVTADEWDAIPEVGDHSLKLKQSNKKETFLPVPDFILESGSQRGGIFSETVDPSVQKSENGGMSTVTGMAEARGAVLTLKLDKMSDSVSGQTVVDPKGYLTGLSNIRVNTDAEVVDIKKAETLLQSVTSTNPKHAPGWVAAARVQEFAGRIVQARKIIREGCQVCPESEDVWIEAARLHTVENAKIILANAVKNIPTSVKIWLQAVELEPTEEKKKIVLRRALEFIPNSVQLWKTAIELETVTDAKIMLARAVECVPQSIEMWLALAKLETHENARKVLNQAREALPTEPLTWITAAKLEEAHGSDKEVVSRIIEKMMVSLAQYEVVIGREAWLKEAAQCEHSDALLTCAAIVRNTIQTGIEDEDRLATWMDDAESCLAHEPPSVHTARAIYNFTIEIFPKKKELWLAASVLEKDYGSSESLETVLLSAVKHCPHAEILWLMAAKEKWLGGNVPGARAILLEAFELNPQSEQIWLAAVKLEWENNEQKNAQVLLNKARAMAPSPRVWLKSALLEREMGNTAKTLGFLDEAIKKYPTYAKYYMMAGQICSDKGGIGVVDFGRAREYYQKGLLQCPSNVVLWILSIRLEEQLRGVNKARSMAEMACLKLPQSDEIWLESIRLERRSGFEKLAETIAAKAIKQFPLSGILWAEDVLTCPKTAQKAKSVEALKKCDNSPEVICAVARLFERDRKTEKARKWFERAIALNPKLGDTWAYLYTFELKQLALTSKQKQQQQELLLGLKQETRPDEVLARCVVAEPNRGELWNSVAKHTDYRRSKPDVVLKKIAEQLLLSFANESKYRDSKIPATDDGMASNDD